MEKTTMFSYSPLMKLFRKSTRQKNSSVKLILEVLEDRTLLSTIVYNVNLTGFTEGGPSSPIDPDLSVVGTITYDTDLQLITSSSLSIKHPAVVAVLPSTLTVQTL